MRVFHVINSAEIGGGGTHLLALTTGLRRHEVDSTVVIGREGPVCAQLQAAGVPVIVIGPMGILTPMRLAFLLKSHRPDLLHLHGSRAGLAGALASHVAPAGSIVYTAHAFSFKRRLSSTLRWAAARAERLTCHTADRVICLTTADVLEATAMGIDPQACVVIPNGVHPRRFATSVDRRAELGFDAQTPVIGMIARLVAGKDPLSFVRMAARIARVVGDARFLIVGEGPLKRMIEREIRTLGLADRVVMTGFRQDVPDLLAAMDVVVLTSLWEGMPYGVLEAMAAGRPVVATRLPGVNEVVVEGETGLLVPPQDAAALASAVVGLLQDRALGRRMGERARERVEHEFTVDRMVDRTAHVYTGALEAARNPGRPKTTTDRPRA